MRIVRPPTRLIQAILALSAVTVISMAAQNPEASGAIIGSVTADRGQVVGLRVKARDAIHKIAYTVFTLKGRYQIYNLPPSTYELKVVEPEFESPVQTVEVKAGETATANLVLKALGGGSDQGAGARGSMAQRSYGMRAGGNKRAVELVDFDTLYPLGPARDILVRACFGCHGPVAFHNRGPMSEAGWRRAVDRMFDPAGRVANLSPGVPIVSYETVSREEKESVIKYLASNFGSGSRPRDLKTDPIPRDETELAQALYIQYELKRGQGPLLANGRPPGNRIHSVFASLQEPGVIWVSGNHSNAILRVDTRDLNYLTRTKEYWIPNEQKIDTAPHGIIEYKSNVYWIELSGDHLGQLDPRTGEIRRYPLPTKGAGGHSLWADSRGNLWYTLFAEANTIGKFDTRTQQFQEFQPVTGWTGYGIIVDRQDRVWVVGLSSKFTLMHDQETGQWKSYPTTTPSRRLAIDSDGKVWNAEYFGNKIAVIDPASDQVTEYDLPLKYGNPYDIWPDSDDNLWIENAVYSALVKFDQKTKKFTYFPFPEIRAHTPKLDRDSLGTIWFTLRDPSGPGIAAFKPKGNVPMKRASE